MSIAKFGTKILDDQDLGLWSGRIPVDLPDEAGVPELHWKGGKLPLELALQMLAFFRFADKKWGGEAQVRLAYNPATREWKAVPLPQWIGTGMASDELPGPKRLGYRMTPEDEALRERMMKSLGEGYVLNGTAHSHCDAPAFASGGDTHDESTNAGLHLTMGRIHGEQVQVHGRVVFRGVKYKVNWEDWIDWELVGCSPAAALVSDAFFFIPPAKLPEFPGHWIDACLEKPKPPPRVETAFDDRKSESWKTIDRRNSRAWKTVDNIDDFYGEYLESGKFGAENLAEAEAVILRATRSKELALFVRETLEDAGFDDPLEIQYELEDRFQDLLSAASDVADLLDVPVGYVLGELAKSHQTNLLEEEPLFV